MNMTSLIRPFRLVQNLAAAALVAVTCQAAAPKNPDAAPAKEALSDGDAAWKLVMKAMQAPQPPAEWQAKEASVAVTLTFQNSTSGFINFTPLAFFGTF